MQSVNATIITIGSELLSGHTIDTNTHALAEALLQINIPIKLHLSIHDHEAAIIEYLDLALQTSSLIIITGGLGPTNDDITKTTLCKYFQTSLVLNEQILEDLKKRYEKVQRPFTAYTESQAWLPKSAQVLYNKLGTAPGMLFEKDNKIIVSLPGVPFEMQGILYDELIPVLKERFYAQQQAITYKTITTVGIGESKIAEKIVDIEASMPKEISLAYLPSLGGVHLRLKSVGNTPALNEVSQAICDRIPGHVISLEKTNIETAIIKHLIKNKQTLACAESCTGGYISNLLTNIPGSSQAFLGGVISYHNQLKTDMLGVGQTTMLQQGAVSEATVKEMVAGLFTTTHADFAVAVSGILGPGGGTPEKPVGTVWMAVGERNKPIHAFKHLFRYNRDQNKILAANTALYRLWEYWGCPVVE